MLFGVPAAKDAVGTQAFDPDGIVQLAWPTWPTRSATASC